MLYTSFVESTTKGVPAVASELVPYTRMGVTEITEICV